MNYEKKYKDALMWIESIYPTLSSEQRMEAEGVFPEIAESEDERIRRALIEWVKRIKRYKEQGICSPEIFNGISSDNILAWLEKQGKKSQGKSITKVWKDMRLEVFAQASGNRHEPNYSYNNAKIFSLNDIDEIIEKISEQNLANSAKTCKDDK